MDFSPCVVAVAGISIVKSDSQSCPVAANRYLWAKYILCHPHLQHLVTVPANVIFDSSPAEYMSVPLLQISAYRVHVLHPFPDELSLRIFFNVVIIPRIFGVSIVKSSVSSSFPSVLCCLWCYLCLKFHSFRAVQPANALFQYW